MKTIEISAMTLAEAIESGDLLVLQRIISGVAIPLAVPSSLLLVAGNDLSGQVVNWTDGSGVAQSATLAAIAEKLAFFTVTDGRLCINSDMLEATPTQDGEVYANGQVLMINTTEVGG